MLGVVHWYAATMSFQKPQVSSSHALIETNVAESLPRRFLIRMIIDFLFLVRTSHAGLVVKSFHCGCYFGFT